MKRRLTIVALGVGLVVVGLVLATLFFPFEPTAITHAQTPVTPIGKLPKGGAGGFLPGGFDAVLWALLAGLGAVILGVGIYVAARKPTTVR